MEVLYLLDKIKLTELVNNFSSDYIELILIHTIPINLLCNKYHIVNKYYHIMNKAIHLYHINPISLLGYIYNNI